MTIKRTLILALAVCCAACGLPKHDGQASSLLPIQESSTSSAPGIIDPGNQQMVEELTGQLGEKRAIFIGEVHDHVGHHQNQLSIIQNLYARYPDLAIGVEYFQQPFQSHLDDYIAGRIDEKEMLVRTEYFKRWKLDYRLFQPILKFAREKHIPVLALNTSDEIHNKVFRDGMRSLSPRELSETPDHIEPASKRYLQRLKAIFDSHPQSNNFATFVEGVLLWDESMAEVTARYLNSHPQSRVVVLAGMVHIMYGDGIPERVNHRLGGNPSALLLNGKDFGEYPGVADYLLVTEGNKKLPKVGVLGVSIMDSKDGVYISELASMSAAQAAGIEAGDDILALNGVQVGKMTELRAMMFDKLPGDQVQMTIRRKDATGSKNSLQFEVTLR